MNKDVLEAIRTMQLNEVTEHVIYAHMARRAKGDNARVLAKISTEEGKHADIWSRYTGCTPKPGVFKILFYRICGLLFGLTFVINLMEAGEEAAQVEYARIAEDVPEALDIYKEEEEHERAYRDGRR